MLSLKSSTFILALFLTSLAKSQFLSSLPNCISECIRDSQDASCSSWDIGCFCRASSGKFLPDLVLCMHDNCDDTPDAKLFLLAPFELACQIAGAPIPASAVKSAEAEASSLAGKGTATATAYPTTMAYSSVLSTVTVTTTKDGTTYLGVYPVAIGSATTVTGKGSTVAIPANTGSATWSPAASTHTSLSTAIVIPSAASSKTTTAPGGVQTNSSPFQNGGPTKSEVGNRLALSVLLVAACALF